MQQGFDINVFREEAKSRWLKPAEVLSILQNHEHIPLTQEPPDRPQSGTLFLFNRRILRFFRKDGHAWRRKKDGRTVGEAHERLKVGNVDALNCYYAHGEQNPYFQRRSFWMLDPAYDHIVLVQYLDISEGRYVSSSVTNLSPESHYNTSTSKTVNGFTIGNSDSYEPYQNSYSPGSAEEVNSRFVIENFEPKNTRATEVKLELRKLAQQLSLDDDINYYDENTIPNVHEDVIRGNNESSRPYQSSYAGSSEETHHRFLDGNFRVSQNNRFDSDQSSQPQVNQALRKLEQQLSLESLNDDSGSVHLEEPLATYNRKEGQLGLGFLHYEKREQETHENISEGLEFGELGLVKKVEGHQSYASSHLPKVSGDNVSEHSERLCTNNGIETKEYSSWTDMLKLSSTSTGISTYGTTSDVLTMNDIPESSNCKGQCCSSSEKRSADLLKQSEKMPWYREDNRFVSQETSESNLGLQLSATRKFLLGSDDYEDYPSRNISLQTNSRNDATIDWMESITVGDIAYPSNFSSTLFEDGQSQSSLAFDSSLTLAQRQQFSIREICPEWAYAGENTKVIITGDFLCDPTKLSWKAMFGDTEVPLQIVQEGVFRCQTPQHGIGKVTICITSGNRESCSEIREFEFCPKPSTISYSDILPTVDATTSSQELLLLARMVQILLYGFDSSAVTKGAINQVEMSVKLKVGNHWHEMVESLNSGCANSLDSLKCIVEELLKDKLPHWLSSKDQHDEQTNCSLSKQELGIIHLISGLGYEWALSSILSTGINVNFRDTNGWTALHWAAYYGREKMVAALLAAGASPGAVTDPTPQDPVGKTPGFLASASGHKGLAGYLSEVALTSHLSSLTVRETEISKVSAEVDAEKAVESISQKNVEMHGGTEDELSLKDSLAAVRNAAQAAARIQAAFRAHSFRKRQQVVVFTRDDYGMTPGDIQEILATSKSHRFLHGSQDQKFDKAALSIQKNYRGWKGHKEFLTLRKNVVKIQAHVRGHQVRKYREFIFTVSFVEKAILRWRRKGVGLRGFRAEPEVEPEMVEDEKDEEDIAKIFRKQKVDAALDEAVSRVLSMVDSPDARQQYRRMIERYHTAKAALSNSDEATSRLNSNFEVMDNDI